MRCVVRARIRPARTTHLIDRLDHPKALKDPPDRREVTELLVLGALGSARRRPQQPGHHLLGAAQVLLVHDARPAVDPRGGHQVVVRLVPALLPHDRCHIWVIHDLTDQVQHRHTHYPRSLTASGPDSARPKPLTIPIARKVPLGLARWRGRRGPRAHPPRGPPPCSSGTSMTRPASTSSLARTPRGRGSTIWALGCTAGSSARTPGGTRSTSPAAPVECCGCGSTASRSTSRAATSTCATTRPATIGRRPGSRWASRSRSARRGYGTVWATRCSRPSTPASARR